MWFLIVSAFLSPQQADQIASTMAATDYPTHAACMAQARPRVAALANIDIHGRYMCMKHGESRHTLAASEKREF